jgi:hypothetical protein
MRRRDFRADSSPWRETPKRRLLLQRRTAMFFPLMKKDDARPFGKGGIFL